MKSRSSDCRATEAEAMPVTRRKLVALAALAPVGLLAARTAQAAACYDAASLPLSQRNRRRSLGYVETSSDPKKACAACAFFAAGAQAGCGTCQMLTGGTVEATAVCNSFAAKART